MQGQPPRSDDSGDGDVMTTEVAEAVTTTTPTDEEVATSTVYPTNEIVIPNVATVDVIFSNGSVLNTVVTAFAFAGVYEVTVNRTERSVDVTVNMLDEGDLVMEEHPEPVDLVVRGPTITDLNGPDCDDDEDDDDDADDEFAVVDDDEEENEGNIDAGSELSKDTDDSEVVNSADVAMLEQSQARLQGHSRWPRGRSHHARRRHRAHPSTSTARH